MMPTIRQFSASRIVIYAADHPPPHVHVVFKDGRECTVNLDNLAVTGRILRREIREELVWVSAQKTALMQAWKAFNP
jgi:hypothetical protein